MTLRSRQRFGKYVIERRIGEGGFATVYKARDTIEGIQVALKIPHEHLIDEDSLEMFRQEVRLSAKLDHPNILPLKYADYIEGKFVVVTALGTESLDERLTRRISTSLALDYTRQLLEAVSCAHEHSIIHCDIKPDNLLIFPGQRLRLTDFGIARIAYRTLQGTGSGTLGYVAPEQALGKPSFRSDVFSIGVVINEMLTGEIPEWPFRWPLPGFERLQSKVHPKLIQLLRKSLEVSTEKRFADATEMLGAFSRIRQLTKPQSKKRTTSSITIKRTWQTQRWNEFKREFGTQLQVKHKCTKCEGPVAEAMMGCPWCGKPRPKHDGQTSFSHACPRCHRGMKADWEYCGWCFGPGFHPDSNRKLSDKRYAGKCTNPKCKRKVLMPFMRYCVWCRAKVKKKWKLEGSAERCRGCGWGVTTQYWSYCPWCVKKLAGGSP